MDRTDEGVGHIPRIPAQRRAVCFDKGRIGTKGREGQLLGFVQDDAGSRRLADSRRSVKEQVLRINRCQFALHGFDSPFLADDGAEVLGTDPFHDRFRQADFFQVIQFLEFPFGLRRFYIVQFFLDEFHLDFPHVFLLLFIHALADFLFQSFFDGLAGQHFSQDHFQLVEDVDDFLVIRHFIIRDVFVDQALQADQALAWIFRMDIRQGRVFAGPKDHLLRPYKTSKSAIKHVDLAAEFFLRRRFEVLMAL